MNEFDKIRIAREELGLSQSDLAGIMGDVPNSVSKLEAGQKKFVPKRYIQFFGSHNYDLNTFFDDERELKKLSDVSGAISEPGEKYYKATDKDLLNKLIEYFGLENKMQLVEYLAQVDENKTRPNLIELALLKTWEDKYLDKFNSLVRQLDQIQEDFLTSAPEVIEDAKKQSNS